MKHVYSSPNQTDGYANSDNRFYGAGGEGGMPGGVGGMPGGGPGGFPGAGGPGGAGGDDGPTVEEVD